MRKLAVVLSFFMVFGFVSVDVGSLFTNPTSVIEIGPDEANARSRSSSRSYRAPSRPRPSRPAPRPVTPKPSPKPAPRATAPPKAAPSTSSTAHAPPKAKAVTPGSTTARTVTPSKPATGGAAAANKRQASSFKASATPKPSIRTASGKTVKVAGTPAASSVRGMSSDRYASRSARQSERYSSYTPERRTVIVNQYGGSHFGDPYSGLFMYSLIGTPHYSAFHYNHWNSYSHARQQSLLAENANLRAEMAAMSGPRNPNYAPPGTDSDLMYSDEFVNAAYNPTPVAPEKSGLGFFAWFLILTLTGGTFFGVYYIFFREVEA